MVAFPDSNGFFDLRFFKRTQCLYEINCKIFIVKKDGYPELIAKFLIRNEVNIKIDILRLLSLKHENIVEIKGAFWERRMHYDPEKSVEPGKFERALVMEYCSGGNLSNFISSLETSRTRLSKNLFLQYSRQIASGINYLHDQGIIHGDLKGENIFLTGTDKEVAKVGDYEDHFITIDDMGREIRGTDGWRAPERYQNIFDFPVDYFSFGLILWLMMVQEEPRQIGGDDRCFDMGLDSAPNNIRALADVLIDPLLSVDPRRRMSIKSVLSSLNGDNDDSCLKLLEKISENDWRNLVFPEF